MLLIGVVLWFVIGIYKLNVLFKDKHKSINIFLSFFLTISLLSFSYVLILFTGLNFMVYQILFTIIPFVFCIYKFRDIKSSLTLNPTLKTKELVLFLASIIGFTVLFFLSSNRWGDWDAWAIWSLHAKFLTHHTDFTLLFSENISWTHPDYPLMLPSIIGSIWKSLTRESALVPAFVAYIISLTFLLTIFASLRELKLNRLSIVVLLIFCFTNILVPFGNSQYADTLLSLFIVLPILLQNHLNTENFKPYIFLIGFFAASCCWIKNEGIVCFLIFSMLFLFYNFKKKKHLLYFSFGAFIPLLFVIYFKIRYAPSTDLISESEDNSLLQLFDSDRYIFILKYIVKNMTSAYSLIIVLIGLALIFNRNYFKSFAFKLLTCLLVAYFFVYVLTPKNLEWHLDTSLTRLLHHIFPVLIYTIMISFGKMKNLFYLKT
jgi:hypothetical protein